MEGKSDEAIPLELDTISKIPFTEATSPALQESSGDSTEPRDLDSYKPIGAPATRKEVWSYYAYYAGNNGIGSFQ